MCLLAALVGVGMIFSDYNLEVWGVALVWTGGVTSVILLFSNIYRHKVPTQVSFDEQTLVVGQDAFERSRITSARRIPSGNEEEVIFDGQRGLPALLMRDNDARSLLDALGLGAGMRRTSFTLIRRFRERFLISLAFCCLLFGPLWLGLPDLYNKQDYLLFFLLVLVVLPMCSIFCAMPLAGLLWLVRGRVEIGADGLTIRWPWKTRHIPFRDISSVHDNGELSELNLANGKRLELCSIKKIISDQAYGYEPQALFNHLKAALELARRRAGQQAEAALPSLLGRNGRDARAWHKHLASLAQSSTYRSEHASPDLLASAVTDADLPPDVRAGAAVALLRAPSPEGRRAVRVAIEACADPDLLATLQELEEASSQPQQEAALRRLAR